MSDLGDLEQRITAALDRIGTGLDVMAVQGSDGGDNTKVDELQAALDAEKTANAQLEERVVAIKEKQEGLVKGLEEEVAKLRAEVSARETDARAIKQKNRHLRENNRALREANQQGVGDPKLINDGMSAELDALRANQASDRAELDSILVELKPLVEERGNA